MGVGFGASSPIRRVVSHRLQSADNGRSPDNRIAVIRGRYGNRPDQQPVVARVDHGMIHSEGRSRRGPQCARHPAAR